MTLLTIIQRTCDLIGVARPAAVVTSTDQTVRQLYALANEEGDSLASSFNWQALRSQYTFTTQASAVQASALPADLDRLISNSFFNRTTRRTVIGPITPQQWQAIQAQPQLNRVFLAFVQRDGQFLVTPTPAAGQTIAYEYISTNWAISPAGVPQDSFTADADTTYLSERLMILGLRWRYLSSRGLPYAEEMRTYGLQVEQVQARDGGNSELSTTGDDAYILSPNIPEGSFPGP
jgi:hypothetical protein